jgi:hypothetical protein
VITAVIDSFPVLFISFAVNKVEVALPDSFLLNCNSQTRLGGFKCAKTIDMKKTCEYRRRRASAMNVPVRLLNVCIACCSEKLTQSLEELAGSIEPAFVPFTRILVDDLGVKITKFRT